MGSMIFNGISTIDMGIVIQSPPVYEFSNKQYELIKIPGKSGNIVIDLEAYDNVKRTYLLAAVFSRTTSFASNAASIVSWLSSSSGYAKLEDSYEPEYYRMALFSESGILPNLQDKATVIQATFDCKPQRYLKSGDDIIKINHINQPGTNYTNKIAIKIINPTNFVTSPEIYFENVVSNMFLSFHSHPTEVSALTATSFLETSFIGDVTISSEFQECYKTDMSEYVNDKVNFSPISNILNKRFNNSFPKLYPGVNWITVSAVNDAPINIDDVKVSIKPKWWTL